MCAKCVKNGMLSKAIVCTTLQCHLYDSLLSINLAIMIHIQPLKEIMCLKIAKIRDKKSTKIHCNFSSS